MPTILHIGLHGMIKSQLLIVNLKSIVLVKCARMDTSANIRQMVIKNVTIFTGALHSLAGS